MSAPLLTVDGYRIKLKQKIDQIERSSFSRGVKAAAAFAGSFDEQIDWPYRFEDVILCKFNLRSGGPRKKKPVKR